MFHQECYHGIYAMSIIQDNHMIRKLQMLRNTQDCLINISLE